MLTLQELADNYLVTADGKTAANPCGAWCGDGDVSNWVMVIRRIREDVLALIDRNKPTVKYTAELTREASTWVSRSHQFKMGNLFHVFGAGTDEVYSLVAFARVGVDLLWRMQKVVEEQDGSVPSAGPMTGTEDPGLPGADWMYGAAGTVIVLGGLYLLLLRAKSK